MEVYIEYVILDNLIMDFLLLKETAKLLKLKYKNLQIFIGAIIGTVGAIVFPLLKILPLYVFLLKILLGLLITFVAIKHNRVFDYIKYFNVFLLFTFLLGGAIIGIFYVAGIDIKTYGNRQSGFIPVGVTILLGYLIVFGVKKLLNGAVKGLMTDRYKYNCIIKCGDVALKVSGYYDSGNLLIDDKTGLPIALCKRKIIDKIRKCGGDIKSTREIDFSTVTKEGKLKLYNIDCILIELKKGNKRTNCLLGEVDNKSIKEELLLGAYVM